MISTIMTIRKDLINTVQYTVQNKFENSLSLSRVRTVMKNLEKSWNFKTAISRPGKVLEK